MHAFECDNPFCSNLRCEFHVRARNTGIPGFGNRARMTGRGLYNGAFLFQGFLFSNPKAGAVIQQTGGLRKVRWAVQGKGKSGGVRVIYFYVTAAAQMRLVAIYKKGIKDDLSAAEKKILKKLHENW